MNKSIYPIIVLCILVTGACVFFNPAGLLHVSAKMEEDKDAQTDDPEGAMRHEFMMTRDPRTNTIPRERLYAAMEYYARVAKTNAFTKGANVGNFNTLTWTQRGPSNIGGRTRTIIFDLNDATRKKVFAGSVGGGLWVCNDITAATPAWTPINDQFANLAVTCIAQDTLTPNTMYFGTGEGWGNADAIVGGGIWKSTDGGVNWARLSSTAGIGDFNYVQKIVVTKSHTVLAATKSYYCNDAGGILRSITGGTSWSRVVGTTGSLCPNSGVGSAVDINGSDIEIGANGDIYASVGHRVSGGGKVYKSTSVSDGASWTDITPAVGTFGTFTRIEIACAPGNSNRLYLTCQGPGSNDVTAILTSSNGGTSWSSCTVPTIYDQGGNSNYTRGQAWYDQICAVDPNNDQTLYIGGVDILKSTDSGSTWTQITSWSLYNDPFNPGPTPFWGSAQNVHADQHAFIFLPGSSTTALSGNDGGIFYSTNLGASPYPSWANKNFGYNITQYYSCAAHPSSLNTFLAGAQDNGSQRFTSVGLNSGNTVSGGDGAFCWISQTNGSNQVSSYVRNNFYVTTNDWGSSYQPSGIDNSGQFINPGDLDHTNGILYTAGNSNILVKWSSIFSGSGAGVTRTNLPVAIGSTLATAIKVSPNTPTTVYIGTNAGNVYRVTGANTGSSPTVAQIATGLGGVGTPGVISSIDVWKKTVGTNDDSIVVSLSSYGVESVYLTANGSSATPTWTSLDDHSTLQDIPVRWAAFSPTNRTIIFLATEVGVLGNSSLSGATTPWVALNNGGLPMVRTDMIQFDSNKDLVAATHGRGLWTSSSTTPLPLRLLAFDAVVKEDDVRLQWNIIEDHEVANYAIERMYSNQPSFQPVAHTTANNSSRYAVTDIRPDWTHGSILYRLKYTTLGGQSYYSSVQRVTKTQGNLAFINSIYPTVTDDAVQINTGTAGDISSIQIAVLNMNGQVVRRETAPYNNYVLHMGNLPAGMYVLSVTDAGGKYRQVAPILKK